MTNRIPIESDLWLRDLTSDIDDPRPELIQLMKEAKPTSEQIEWFMDGVLRRLPDASVPALHSLPLGFV